MIERLSDTQQVHMTRWLCFSALLISAWLFLPETTQAAMIAAERSPVSGSEQLQQHITPLSYTRDTYSVAYFEAGEYWEFTEIFNALQEALKQDSDGGRLAFPQTYHYSPGWDLPEQEYEKLAQSIMDNADIDMVVALGSVASKALFKRNNGKKPVICLDVANPALIGLINLETQKPVASNFFIDYVPDKWNKSITLMDILQHVNKIGTLSSNTEEGRTYSNIKELRDVGRERGFEVVTYEQLDVEESVPSCKKGIEALIAQGIDALYVPAISCFDPKLGDPVMLYGILHDHKVKTYAKDGKIPVANGALIGISTLNYQSIGQFFSSVLLQHVVGSRPHTEAVLPFEPKIYLNLATARKLTIALPVNLLINVDGIYDNTLPPIKEWP